MVPAPKPIRLQELLRQEELASSEQVGRVLARCAQAGDPFAVVVLEEEILDEEDLFFLLSRGLGVPTVPEERLLHLTLSPDLRRRVPRSLARRGILVPFDLDKAERRLSVAMLDPSDLEMRGHLRRISGVADIHVYLARRSVILRAIDVAYGVEADLREHVALDELTFDGDEPQKGTQVELIPGKVSLDPALLEEMAAISPQLVEDSLHPKSPPRMSQASGPRERAPEKTQRGAAQRGALVKRRMTPARGEVRARPPRPTSLPENMPALPEDARDEPVVRHAPAPRGGAGGRARRARDRGPNAVRREKKGRPAPPPGPREENGPLVSHASRPQALTQEVRSRGRAGDDLDREAIEETHERLLPEANAEASLLGVPDGLDDDAHVRTRILDRRALDDRTPIESSTFEEIRDRAEKTPEIVTSAPPVRPKEALVAKDSMVRVRAAMTETPVDLSLDKDGDFLASREGEGQTRVDGYVLDFAEDEAIVPTAPPTDTAASEALASVPGRTFEVEDVGVKTPSEGLLGAEAIAESEGRGDLVADLVVGIEVLIALFEQRVDSEAAGSRACGHLASAIARELDLDAETVLCVGLAAQLFSLDGLLRRERGEPLLGDVAAIFNPSAQETGGLNLLLRQLGARCLQLDRGRSASKDGVMIVALIRDYMDLRSSDPDSDLEMVVQLLRTGGADPFFLDALVRAVERVEGHDLRTERRKPGMD